MKNSYANLFLALLLCILTQAINAQVVTWNNQVFQIDTLTDHLGFPWEVTYGPDDSLWITEARGYKITKVDPTNGGKRTVLSLFGAKNFNRPDMTGGQWPQGGMMGLALHPKLLSGKPYLYVAYVYQFDNCLSGNNGCFFWTRIIRYTYNIANGTLGSAVTVITGLAGSNDHNSGRLTIGPDPTNPTDTAEFKLYYSIGDMGAGQFNNLNRTNNAQNINVYEGKILRFNLEPDAAQSGGDEWIPDNNPFPTSGLPTDKTPVYSYGHRNAQGLVWGKYGATYRLYSSEHGDKSDDEVNIINAGTNYGWPRVAGLCDDNYNTFDGNPDNNLLANQTVPNEIVNFCNGNPNQQPMFSLFNAAAANVPSSGANIFTWPTVAPSSIDFYSSYPNTIPGWNNSLLVTSLKYGLFRLKLKTPGDRVDSSSTSSLSDTIPYFHGNRIRDVAINPHGDTLYFAIDSSGSTSGPTGGFNGGNIPTANAGRILRVVYIRTLALQEYIPPKPVNNRTYVKVFPNPASHVLYVQSKRGMHKPLRAELWDITGKLVMQEQTSKDNFALGLEMLTKGVYIFKLYNGYGVLMTTEKIVVQ
jgi:aldose sugar dehydrogenase